MLGAVVTGGGRVGGGGFGVKNFFNTEKRVINSTTFWVSGKGITLQTNALLCSCEALVSVTHSSTKVVSI